MTSKLSAKVLALVSAACLMSSCSSSWQYIDMSASECVRTTELALRDADFTEGLQVVHDADSVLVVGEHAGYQAKVTCQPNIRTVEVAGFDPDQVQFYKKSIIKRF